MKLTKRSKKRLILVAGLTVLLAAMAAGLLAVRAMISERRVQQARADGLEHFEAGRYFEAVQSLGRYYGRYPDDVEATLKLAEARLKVPEPDGREIRVAAALYRSIVDREPGHVAALEGLLDIYRRMGRRVDMMDVAHKILEQSPAHEKALLAAIQGHLLSGNFEAAKSRVVELTRLDPTRYDYREIEMTVLERSGAEAAALLDYCNRLLVEAPVADGRWYVLRGRTRLRFQNFESGQADLLEATRLGVEQGLFEYLLWTLEAIGQREAADTLLADARRSTPEAWWPVEVAVRREWVHGRLDRAQAVLDERLTEPGSDATTAVRRWQALLATVRQDQSQVRELLNVLDSQAPTLPADERDVVVAWIDAIRARMEASDGRWREALRAYERALARLPDGGMESGLGIDVAVLFHLQGEAYAMLGETASAVRSFRRAFDQTRSMWVVAGVHLVESLLRLGRLDEAFTTIVDLTRRTQPSVPGPYLALGRVWLAIERNGLPLPETGRSLPWRDAMTYLRSIREASNDLPDLLPLLAQAMVIRNDRSGLASLLAEAAGRSDLSDGVRVQLVQIAADMGLETPAPLMASAITPEGRVDLAWAKARGLAQAGRVEAGLAEIDRLATELPDSATMRWRLARLRYLDEFKHASLASAVDELAAQESLPLEALDTLISLDSTWQRKETVQQILAHLESQVPEGSSRLLLAKAQVTLRFDADDQQALASALADLEGLRERGGHDTPAVLTTLARLHLAIGPSGRRVASGLLRQVVETWPQMTSVYPQLIALLQELGEFSAAERYLRQLEAFQTVNPEVGRATASLLARQGDFDGAVARFGAVASASGSQADRLMLAAWRMRAGQYDEADALLTELVRETPCAPMAALLAVQFQVARGDWRRAEAILNEATLERESVRLLLWGAYHTQRGNHAEAERFLLQAAQSDPENATTSIWLARHAMMQGDADAAIRIATQGLTRHPDDPDLRLLVASAALGGDEASRREALKTFEQLHGDNAPLIETVRLFSRVVSSDGAMSRKAEDLKAVASLAERHPTFMPAARLAFMLHRIANDQEGARRIAEQSMLRMPSEPEPAKWLTELQIERRELEAALISAEAWRRRSLADPYEASVVLASIALDLRDFNRAYQVLAPIVNRFRADRSHDPRGFDRWVATLMLSGRIDEAYREVAEDISGDAGVFYRWLQNAQALPGDSAVVALARITEQATSLEQRLNLALAWATVGQRSSRQQGGSARASTCFVRAREAVTAAQGGSAPTPEILRTMAIIAAAEGQTEDAIQRYRDLLRRDPDDPIALNNLAMLLVTAASRPDEALPLSDRLIALHADVVDFLDTHALVLLHVGRLDDAIRTIDGALVKSPDNPALLLTRARIQVRRGDMAGARATVARVESLLRHVLIVPVELADALNEVQGALQARGKVRQPELASTRGVGA